MREVANINSLEELSEFSKTIADYIDNNNDKGIQINLSGELGAGKTALTKLIAKDLGINKLVTSPTFNISRKYITPNGRVLAHYDLYRLQDYDQSIYEDIQEDLYNKNIVIIEWSERMNYTYDVLKINIALDNENRIIYSNKDL